MKFENLNLNDLCFVEIANPYTSVFSSECERSKKLFFDTLNLKKIGYEAEYKFGVLPVDATDFIATHLLVCVKQSLLPLTAFKTTNLKSCITHALPFPGMSLVQQGGNTDHILFVNNEIELSEKTNKELFYTGSWTIDPSIRKTQKELSKLLVNLFKAMYYFYHQQFEKNIGIFTGGTIRFKAHNTLQGMGHQPVQSSDGRVLPNLNVKHLFYEPVQFLYLNKFNKEFIETVLPYFKMWEDRMILSQRSMKLNQVA